MPDYSSRLAKSREPLAEEGAKTSKQVIDVAPTTDEAPTTETIENNTTEGKVGDARRSRRAVEKKAAEMKSRQKDLP